MVAAVVPLKNAMRFAMVNGTVIKQMLEHALSGVFPAVDGITVEFDPARQAGSRVTYVGVRRSSLPKALTPCGGHRIHGVLGSGDHSERCTGEFVPVSWLHTTR